MGTPKPKERIWTLIAPDGTDYKASSPLKCVQAEQKLRVPAAVALENTQKFLAHCDCCGDVDAEFIMAKDTPAELHVCGCCRNTLLSRDIQRIKK